MKGRLRGEPPGSGRLFRRVGAQRLLEQDEIGQSQAEEAALDPGTLFNRGRELMNAGDYDAAAVAESVTA